MNWLAKWIKTEGTTDVCPVFFKNFTADGEIASATLNITAIGVYEAEINGSRVGDFILAPGWTSYRHRLQYQSYDVTAMLKEENRIEVTVGKGWYRTVMPFWITELDGAFKAAARPSVLAQLDIVYASGKRESVLSDRSWEVRESCVRFSEIYDGEICDMTAPCASLGAAEEFAGYEGELIPQQGEKVIEQERIRPRSIYKTPKGETVVDFGQNIAGYVEIELDAKEGDVIELDHGEVPDKDGNFYNANYRAAHPLYRYTCAHGHQTAKARFTFFGFRYVKLVSFPGTPTPDMFTAVAVYSDMKRTGRLDCGEPVLQKFFSNVVWGLRGNFLDIPTDCPQRDERLGWTGDAQMFIGAASYFYDVERFFDKWLSDLSADQLPDGAIPHTIPDTHQAGGSAGWCEAATVIPWQLYLTYGSRDILRRQYDSMKKYICFITASTKDEYLWTGGTHFGDWVGLDAEPGSYKGASREDFIATAYYAYSTSFVIKIGRILGEDVSGYETLYENVVAAFRRTFTDYRTQTEMVLAAHFSLAEDPQAAADMLAERVKKDGHLMTGFVGTPYLLHVLSDHGHTALAYSLLLRREYPGWLYAVMKGATTVWEHWDGIMEDGSFWSTDMNSFNHYAYGAVLDWVYSKAAGIRPDECSPGYERLTVAPQPDRRLGWLRAQFVTRHGEVVSKWTCSEESIRYEISVPVKATIIIAGKAHEVEPGDYIFYSANET